MRVLITGATGFVGQHLTRLLMGRKHEIFGTYLVRNSTQFPAKIKLLHCDLCQRESVLRIVRQLRPERVYHLAAFSSVKDSLKDPQAVYENNFIGTLNLLEAIRDATPRARILLVGSGQCYGRVAPKRLPITESEILLPENPYSASKAAADLLGYQFFCSYGLHVVRARPFNHTGPGQSAEFVCSDFARQIAEIDLKLKPPPERHTMSARAGRHLRRRLWKHYVLSRRFR
jgi:GDP-4-dehydro-6-deoxy-D-mannose reductase